MKKNLSYLASVLAIFISINSYGQNFGKRLLMTAKLEGSQEVPQKVITSGIGVAGLTLNDRRDTIFYNISVANLSSPIIAAHFHLGSVGVSGPAIYNITQSIKGNRIVGFLTKPNFNKDSVARFLRGEIYVNVHTTRFPNGEIRGQVQLDKDWSFRSILLPLAQSATTNYSGIVTAKLSKDSTRLTIHGVINKFTNQINYVYLVKGQTHVDTISSTGAQISEIVNPKTYLADLLAGNIAVYVNTLPAGSGDLIGTLQMNKKIAFDAKIDGAQEADSLAYLPGRGVLSLQLSSSFDTLWYEAALSNIGSPLVGAHLHVGAPKVAGRVIIPLEIDATNNRVMGRIVNDGTNKPITQSLVDSLLLGHIYFNAHTEKRQGGEIRGQVLRFARIGYTFSADTIQEIPDPKPTRRLPQGAGVVSMDRDSSNLCYGIVLSGLSDTLKGAHFHQGLTGETGIVVHTLTPAFKVSDSTAYAFDFVRNFEVIKAKTARLIDKDSIYFNAHTSLNKDGELRGQVLKTLKGPSVITAVNELNERESASMIASPNPANDHVFITLSAVSAEAGEISVMDVTGRTISTSPITLASGQNSYQVNLSNLHSGIYMIQVENSNGKMMKRINKN